MMKPKDAMAATTAEPTIEPENANPVDIENEQGDAPSNEKRTMKQMENDFLEKSFSGQTLLITGGTGILMTIIGYAVGRISGRKKKSNV